MIPCSPLHELVNMMDVKVLTCVSGSWAIAGFKFMLAGKGDPNRTNADSGASSA